MKKLTNDNFSEIEIGEIYTFNICDNHKNMIKRIIELDANIICIIKKIEKDDHRIYFNIILSNNNIYWRVGPDEVNTKNWEIMFEKIKIENETTKNI